MSSILTGSTIKNNDLVDRQETGLLVILLFNVSGGLGYAERRRLIRFNSPPPSQNLCAAVTQDLHAGHISPLARSRPIPPALRPVTGGAYLLRIE
ncbi:MAG: hypothetical protein R3C51_11560 [Parvularculaceae bacterium]